MESARFTPTAPEATHARTHPPAHQLTKQPARAHRSPGVVGHKGARHVGHVGAPPAVDGLVGVAHHKQAGLAGRRLLGRCLLRLLGGCRRRGGGGLRRRRGEASGVGAMLGRSGQACRAGPVPACAAHGQPRGRAAPGAGLTRGRVSRRTSSYCAPLVSWNSSTNTCLQRPGVQGAAAGAGRWCPAAPPPARACGGHPRSSAAQGGRREGRCRTRRAAHATQTPGSPAPGRARLKRRR